MMLIEQTSIPASALPVQEFRDHLRLGTGFEDVDLQDGLLEAYLRSALSAIEARTGKAILERSFSWNLTAWSDGLRQSLPIAPVQSIIAIKTIDVFGIETIVSPLSYGLSKDLHRPALVTTASCLPQIPQGGSVEIEMSAGFGSDWVDVPEDLAQAVLLLATEFYEKRAGSSIERGFPESVLGLIGRYRAVRLGGGQA